ncbi:MAG TPA: HPP family protein [Xanthomonadales bacterium]|nr:HPP family protein [Xanthomonadales bacterium]
MNEPVAATTVDAPKIITERSEKSSGRAAVLAKLRGGGAVPARPPLAHVGLTWLGGFLAIATVALLGLSTETVLVLGSFGASCVLVFGFPESPFSQPRNVVAGHFIASLTGLVFLHALGPHWWSMALALATAIALMQLTRTVHPPAGSNPLIVFLGGASWQFLLTPTLLGAMALVLVALVYNNLPSTRRYPHYWF